MPMPARMIGLYALATMQREGPVYGYRVTQRIAERTAGSWRPGAGAIYPALTRLVDRGLARGRTEGRRRVYEITPKGRALLERIRAARASRPTTAPDLSVVWAEISGMDDVGEFLLLRVRRSLDAAEGWLGAHAASAKDPKANVDLREGLRRELTARLRGLEGTGAPGAARATRPRRGGRR